MINLDYRTCYIDVAEPNGDKNRNLTYNDVLVQIWNVLFKTRIRGGGGSIYYRFG